MSQQANQDCGMHGARRRSLLPVLGFLLVAALFLSMIPTAWATSYEEKSVPTRRPTPTKKPKEATPEYTKVAPGPTDDDEKDKLAPTAPLTEEAVVPAAQTPVHAELLPVTGTGPASTSLLLVVGLGGVVVLCAGSWLATRTRKQRGKTPPES